MNHMVCLQVSIDSPGPSLVNCVSSQNVPVPEAPPKGALIKVVCAGACYRTRRSSSVSSSSSYSGVETLPSQSPAHRAHKGVRDAALFPGYEVAGIIDTLGEDVRENEDLKVGDRVVIYPYEGVPAGYAEYTPVPDLKYLVRLPDSVSLNVAAMLPCGALLAMSTVHKAHEHVQRILAERSYDAVCKILIIGTGGLSLWGLRIASYHYSRMRNRVSITVASLRDEGFKLAKESERVNVVQWGEDIYEGYLIERTKNACQGLVDVVIDFGSSRRSLDRSLQCLAKNGVVLINSENGEELKAEFDSLAQKNNQTIELVAFGSVEDLRRLVELVANNEIEPPPLQEFPVKQASEAVCKLGASEIQGRAILRFQPNM